MANEPAAEEKKQKIYGKMKSFRSRTLINITFSPPFLSLLLAAASFFNMLDGFSFKTLFFPQRFSFSSAFFSVAC